MFKRLFKWLIIGLIASIFVFALFVAAVNFEMFGHLYSKKELKAFKNESATLIYASDKQIIGKFFAENRTNIVYDQIPKHVINALVATEDARYFEHEGIDSRSLVRVLFKTILLNDRSSGGGSTITQQLLKNMYGRKSFGPLTMLVNKTKEALLANRLEEIYSKEEILALYLNTIPFGENVYGIESASRLFFNKTVQQLAIEEGAVLVGMLKANTYYNPRLHPKHAFDRRNVVFNQMAKYGYLNVEQSDTLKLLPLMLDYANFESSGSANYFLVEVKKELTAILANIEQQTGEKWDFRKDGLRVETTLNSEIHGYGLSAFQKHLRTMQNRLRKQYSQGKSKDELHKKMNVWFQKNGKDKAIKTKQEIFSWDSTYSDAISVWDSLQLAFTTLHAGMLSVDPKTGAILSWIGGIDFRTQPYDQIQAKRQLASTFKPILYAAALEKGLSPCDYLSNTAKVFTDQGNWKVSNYDHSEGGEYSLTGALIRSKNIPTVDLLFKVGFDEVDYLWRKMGLTSSLDHVPAMALGIADASLYELAGAYTAFANGGEKVPFYSIDRIYSADGSVIYERSLTVKKERIMEPRTAVLINEMLQRAINNGTGTAIRNTYNVKLPLAGKTGTSQNFGDAWFASYNPNLVMVTRVGASYSSIHFNTGRYGSGGRLALPLVGLTLAEMQKQSNLVEIYGAKFDKLSIEVQKELDCPDFEEDNTIDKIKGIFSKKSTTMDQSEKKQKGKKTKENQKKQKKGWFNKKNK